MSTVEKIRRHIVTLCNELADLRQHGDAVSSKYIEIYLEACALTEYLSKLEG